MIILISLLIQMAQAQWFDQGWNFEAAFGITNQEITNPNGTKAIYDGYGGHALIAYPLFQNENYSFGPQAQYFYSELNNKANTSNLTEEIKFYGIAPGLELKVYYFFVDYNYRYQWLSVALSGALAHKTHSRIGSSQIAVGIELPLNNWAFRLYYARSAADLPAADTGLSADSPWAEENVFLALRYRFGKKQSSEYRPSTLSEDRGDSASTTATPHRSIRYTPRPSPRLNGY